MALEHRRSAGYMTNWAARAFTPAIERRLKPLGVSAAYLPVFFALSDGGELPQKALAAAASVEQPTMTLTLRRMARDGLIERRVDPADRRSTLVSLSDAGNRLVPEVQRATAEVNAIALAPLTTAEREAFLGALAKIVGALAEDRIP